jgi:regulator of ribonuclease activity A
MRVPAWVAGTVLIGDLIADLAASNGWEGVIIHGAVRDVEALSKINLGIRAIGSNSPQEPQEPQKLQEPQEPQEPQKLQGGTGDKDVEVTFGEVTFTPGCHVYRDADGILTTRE